MNTKLSVFYLSKCKTTIAEYRNGCFYQWTNVCGDKISIEALRHDIAMYEEDIDRNLFEKIITKIDGIPPKNTHQRI